MKLTLQSEIHTRHSKQPVRLSGVFIDAAGSIKGLTVLRVLPGATPNDKRTSTLSNIPQKVFCERAEVGVLDPFWWQLYEVASADATAPVSANGGAMTCLFNLAKGVEAADERWLKGQARIAAPEAYVDKPVYLAEGGDIGVIADELNHLPLERHSIYPLLKLRRSQADKAADVGIRNGAMVFTQDGAMIGVIAAIYGDGQFYSVIPIEDIMEWHALSFITEPPQDYTQPTEDVESIGGIKRPLRGSIEVVQLTGR